MGDNCRASPIGAQGGNPPAAVGSSKGDEWGTTAAQSFTVATGRMGTNAAQSSTVAGWKSARRAEGATPRLDKSGTNVASGPLGAGETLNGARRSPDGNAAGSVRARLGGGEAQTRIETTQQTDKRQRKDFAPPPRPPARKRASRGRAATVREKQPLTTTNDDAAYPGGVVSRRMPQRQIGAQLLWLGGRSQNGASDAPKRSGGKPRRPKVERTSEAKWPQGAAWGATPLNSRRVISDAERDRDTTTGGS